eukprot:CAMPEP_0115586856 /NCGR_PEP_ID=MMETSP0272-20121206/7911_1 /TAXON_ID=71861 /ORGANISM="Scrippsiella trochoidea, Strain CCMP3099" /LENGTH=70 /DNA_ID=CAMNT_0003021927 /DNA_START=300 /DNA_END=512 /DNA_ORIENTATION=+
MMQLSKLHDDMRTIGSVKHARLMDARAVTIMAIWRTPIHSMRSLMKMPRKGAMPDIIFSMDAGICLLGSS